MKRLQNNTVFTPKTFAAGILCTLFGALLVFLASCGTEKATQSLDSFDGLYTSYLSSCAECHNPQNEVYARQVIGFDMTSADKAYASLGQFVNIKRIDGCQSVKYVAAGAPDKSYLVAILDPAVKAKFKLATGANCEPLNHSIAYGGQANTPSSEVMEALKKWVSSGAKK